MLYISPLSTPLRRAFVFCTYPLSATLLFALHINFNERFFARKRISKDFFYYLLYQFHILIAILVFQFVDNDREITSMNACHFERFIAS